MFPFCIFFRAGFQYGLKPVMAEVYNLPTPHYYVVAVTKQRDNSSELIYLKRKSTCHTGVRNISIALMLLNDVPKLLYEATVFCTQTIFNSLFPDWSCRWMDYTHGMADITGKST